MTKTWKPANTDTAIEMTDPANPETWRVIKGTKSVKEYIEDNLNDVSRPDKDEIDLKAAQLETRYQIKIIKKQK